MEVFPHHFCYAAFAAVFAAFVSKPREESRQVGWSFLPLLSVPLLVLSDTKDREDQDVPSRGHDFEHVLASITVMPARARSFHMVK